MQVNHYSFNYQWKNEYHLNKNSFEKELNNMKYIETSALDTTNVEQAFSSIILGILNY